VFERESYPFGITVNRDGVRFVDEGSDYGAYTYAKYGRQILHQPEQRAWQLFDAQSASLLTSEYRYKNPEAARITAKSIEELADLLGTHGLQADAVYQTIRKFNAAVLDNSPFSPYEKDGRRTKGLATEKTNWARGLTQPPFEAYEVTCGITFTFGGLRIDTDARVLDHGGRCIAGLYACGESVGGLYYFNYGSGTGLTSGAVLGRIAGRRAAVN
jgi:tricarballylate dehydrogenase